MINLVNLRTKVTEKDYKIYDLDSGNFDKKQRYIEYRLKDRNPDRKPAFSKKYNPKKPSEGSCSNCRMEGMLNSEGLCLSCASKKYSLKSIESKN
tara:strand:- start:6617 stop:6901 length:285 start_codon:yes stop_codon:yes gene_type:complete